MDQKTWLCRKKASEKTILATLEEVIPKEKELDLENSLKILNEELASVVDECSAKGTTRITLRGNLSKVAYAIALALCQGGIQVYTILEDDYKKLKENLTKEAGDNLVLSKHNAPETWLVGDGLTEEEQLKAPKGTIFISISHFPPKKMRKDCFYNGTPAMLAPKHLENVDSCENWLPRRVMSAWRIAGILHAMEGWDVHECGNIMFDVEKIWRASLDHGFRPAHW